LSKRLKPKKHEQPSGKSADTSALTACDLSCDSDYYSDDGSRECASLEEEQFEGLRAMQSLDEAFETDSLNLDRNQACPRALKSRGRTFETLDDPFYDDVEFIIPLQGNDGNSSSIVDEF
jgi:hypothetical protein